MGTEVVRAVDVHEDLDEREFLGRMEHLEDELPVDSAVAAFERASSLDSTGHSGLAVPLCRRALGLEGGRRRRAVIQLASSLRNLGQAPESAALLTAEREVTSNELDAVEAFLALAALAPHLPRYQRSLANYAGLVGERPPD